MSSPFEVWREALDKYLVRWYYATWNDLAGDLDPIYEAWNQGESPAEFAERFARKYDLIRREA